MDVTSIDLEFLVGNKTITVHINLRPQGRYSSAAPTAMLQTESENIAPSKLVVTHAN